MDKMIRFRDKWLIYIIALVAGTAVGCLIHWFMGKDVRITSCLFPNLFALALVFIMNNRKEAKKCTKK